MECVLMQAWKKTSAYLRSRSWYSDTLGLDMTALRIPSFLREIQKRLEDPRNWTSRPLKLVPAPKSQHWEYANGNWGPHPSDEVNIQEKIRPLAHVDLQDQVVATAIMLCLADRVESRLGNPRLPITSDNRRKVLAYGHRLFCDSVHEKPGNGTRLRHRWGSSKSYRAYFHDYQKFLGRPKIVVDGIVEELKRKNSRDNVVVTVHTDLSKFYDRVSPDLLNEKLRKFQVLSDEDPFFDLAECVLNWKWDENDQERADVYAKANGIGKCGFETVVLPQGLVSSGFFANISLIDLDTALRLKLGTILDDRFELRLHDACYYVDDLRLVLTFPISDSNSIDEEVIKSAIIDILDELLSTTAGGLEISEKKTVVIFEGNEKRFLVKQSKEAKRIQTQVSGTFDMARGTELIGAIEGFFSSQHRFREYESNGSHRLLIGIPDMADDTVARFAAGKMRRTFRSLRPLLEDEVVPEFQYDDHDESDLDTQPQLQLTLSKSQLDERGKVFAAHLIEEWVRNPGNVRLLRIAFDFYPDHRFLDDVLNLLRVGWEKNAQHKTQQEIPLYCLAELFRAGATETGIVPENELERLPGGISVQDYHVRLLEEALEITNSYISNRDSKSRFPWYLMQQVLLYLAVRGQVPEVVMKKKATGEKLLQHYWRYLNFIRGYVPSDIVDRSTLLIESYTALGLTDFRHLPSINRASHQFLAAVNSISPSAAKQLWENTRNTSSSEARRFAIRQGFEPPVMRPIPKGQFRLTESTRFSPKGENPFFEEENLLQLARFLLKRDSKEFETPILPSWIQFSLEESQGFRFRKLTCGSIALKRKRGYATELFKPPDWCESNEERQRFNIGLLLRYALIGSPEFLSSRPRYSKKNEPRYKTPVSHWEQQRYAGYQGRDAFGPPWLPISIFVEELLIELLRWPGSGTKNDIDSIPSLRKNLTTRLSLLKRRRGQYTSATFLEQSARWPYKPRIQKSEDERPLRIGIVQSAVPGIEDYVCSENSQLDAKEIRHRRRAHLASLMTGVEQMIKIRNSHIKKPNQREYDIDLLVFPELSIHPDDVSLLILPFVRQHKCIVLMGQVYHHSDDRPDAPLINSALWLIPELSKTQGLQIKHIEQGKEYLTEAELSLSPTPVPFRPAQWLIEYHWHKDVETERPLFITSSICNDATDIALAADLGSRSDLCFICALNKDVGTFDRMTEALHYHMYQGVILVNSGEYGGSSFFMPFHKPYNREVFHLHGQQQASIAFAEVNPKELVHRPNNDPPTDSLTKKKKKWKSPPAGWKNPGDLI